MLRSAALSATRARSFDGLIEGIDDRRVLCAEQQAAAEATDWIERLHTVVAGDATGVGYVNMIAGARPAHSEWTRARLRAVREQWGMDLCL